MAKYDFLNYFRARRFSVMLVTVLIISGLLSFAIAYCRPYGLVGAGGNALGFHSTVWGSFIYLVVILSSGFFGGDAISAEFQNRTGYFLDPNPIRRSAIYVGKWLAALAASSIVLMIHSLVMVANGLYYFPGSLLSEFLQALAYTWVYLVAALSMAFAFSSLFKSSSISILMSVILLLIVFPTIDWVSSVFAHIEPWFSITCGAEIVTQWPGAAGPAISGQGPEGVSAWYGSTFRLFTPTVPEGLAILGACFIVTALFGLWLFQRKEFTT